MSTIVATNRPILTDAMLDPLRQSMRGPVLTPGNTQYDAARQIWNAMIDRRPGAIAQCLTSADVQAAVAFAKEHDLALSIRGGGHNIAGLALCDGGVTIDFSLMKAVHVDAEAKIAVA